MRQDFIQWVACAIVMLGLGLVAGYWLMPGQDMLGSVDTTTLQFPTIAFNKFGTQSVSVRNVTNRPIQLAVRAECHCTNVEPASLDLRPGQSAKLQVHYRPKFIAEQAFSVEQSNVRFEFYDGHNLQLIVVPLSAQVLHPVIMKALPLSVAQFGTKPANFQWELALARDVETIHVAMPPKFASEIKIVESTNDARKKIVEGKTHSRFEFADPQDELVVAGTTRDGQKFEISIPVSVRFQEAFRLENETIYLQSGKSCQLRLNQLDSANYSSVINAMRCEMTQVSVQGSADSVWQLSTDSAESSTGYLRVNVCTVELSSGKELFTELNVPIFIN